MYKIYLCPVGALQIKGEAMGAAVFVAVDAAEGVQQRIYIYIEYKATSLRLCSGTIAPESRNKNYSAPIGSMGNYLLSAESFM